MSEFPFCEDCVFYKRKWFSEDLCMKFPKSLFEGLVWRGSPRKEAWEARLYDHYCGEKGKDFVPKVVNGND